MSNPKIKYISTLKPPFSSSNLYSIIQSQIPSSLLNCSISRLNIYYNDTHYFLNKPNIRFSINNKDILLSPLAGTLELENVNITQFSLSQFSREQVNETPENLYIIYGLT